MLNNYCQQHKGLFFVCWIVFILLLASLFILSVVLIQNEIERGKYISQNVESKNTISVSETGEVYAKPDLALVELSVITEKASVSEAMSENTELMNNVIDVVKEEGVEEKDLKTVSFNLYPRYDYLDSYIYPPSGKRVLTSYEIRQTLEVKIRDLNKIGQIIQSATETGANQVGHLQLTIDNEEELKSKARENAIEKAKAKAEKMAEQLAVDLGDIVSFTESSYAPIFYMERAEGMGGGSPDIEMGENKVEVTVNITYQTK